MAWRLTLSFAAGSSIFLRSATDPPRPKRAGQKIVLQRQISDRRMQGLHIDDRFWLGLRGFTENPGRALKQRIAPLLDPVRVNVEILRQLEQRLLALDRSYSHFRLQCRAVGPRAVVWSWPSPRSQHHAAQSPGN